MNEQVRRNLKRFPPDFMFQLTFHELSALRSQIATLEPPGRGKYRKYLPYAFTEYGVAMLSSVLNSECAIQVNMKIMRTFGRLRQLLSTHADLARKLNEMEGKYDANFKTVFNAIRQLMAPPLPKNKSPIGFKVKE